MSDEGRITMEHSTLLEEYRSIREDIIFNVNSSRQVINLSLTAAGVLFAGAPYIIQSQLPILFLAAPIIFYALSWSQMRYHFVHDALEDYLTSTVVPRIRQTLKDSSCNKESDYQSVMSWVAFIKRNERKYRTTSFLTTSSNYILNLLIATLSIAAYFVILDRNPQISTTILDTVLIVINMIFLFYSIFLGIRFRYFLTRNTKL